MIRGGLVSITFRKLRPEQIVDLVTQAGLEGIEWGGDIHVPHGDVAGARAVKKLTDDAGLEVAAYGSYYRAGETEGTPDFAAVLDSASELQAPTVRVWSGKRPPAMVDPEYRKRVVEDLQRVCELAAARGMTVSTEYHDNTLTEARESAKKLYGEVGHENLRTLWQTLLPPEGRDLEEHLLALEEALPLLSNLHVFRWVRTEDGIDRRALGEGEEFWPAIFAKVATTGRDHWALIEFVRGETGEQFLEDAAVLKRWLGR